MRLPCPWCGLRDADEFHYGGASSVVRPPRPADVSDSEWADYLFFRDNRKGLHRERWVHAWGCRQWFVLERDTQTHEIFACADGGRARNGGGAP